MRRAVASRVAGGLAAALLMLLSAGPASAATGGGISGQVTNAAGTLQLSDVEVVAFDANGDYVAAATTDHLGRYAISGLAPGDYELEFVPASSGYVQQYDGDAATLADAPAVVVTAGATTTGIDAALAPAGAISGRVTESGSGTPVANATVLVLDAAGGYAGSSTTDAGGAYSVAGLSDGSYTVQFQPTGSGDLASQFYSGASQAGGAEDVSVAAGATTSGIDAALGIQGTVAGVVTDAMGGGPVADAEVELYDGTNVVAATQTDAAGNYALGGVGSGSYALEVNAGASGDNYAPWYYDGTASLSAATDVSLVSGKDTAVDVALSAGGEISGTVSDASTGDVLENVAVDVYDASGDVVASTDTDGSGDYLVAGLSSGSYRVGFVDEDDLHAAAFYGGAATLPAAATVSVSAGADTTGVSAGLGAGANITGTVSDGSSGQGVGGVSVQALDSDGDVIQSALTGPDGGYTLSGLDAGTYTLAFMPGWSGGQSQYTQGYYDQGATGDFSAAAADATALTLTGSGSTAGVDATLTGGGAVSGTVTGQGAAALGGAVVELWSADGALAATATTDASGSYLIGGVAPGAYNVSFAAADGSYLGQYYPDTDAAGAGTITVSDAQVTDDVDASLAPAGAISGTVTDASTGAGLAGIEADVYDADGNLAASVQTTDGGSYTATGLAAGGYTVAFAPAGSGGDEIPAYYDGQSSAQTATTVTVTAGATTNKIDDVLQQAGTIAGTVSEGDGTTPASGAEITVYDTSGNYIATTETAADGSYSIEGLQPGTYVLEFTPAPTDYDDASSYSGGAYNLGSATPVTVSAGVTTDLDGSLTQGGSIAGIVSDSTSDVPIAGVEVSAYDGDGDFIASTSTDSAGRYTFYGLAPGGYTLDYSDEDGGSDYTGQWYPDATSESQADGVLVRAGEINSGVDVALQPAGQISGTVTSPSGEPIAGIEVSAYGSDGQLDGSTTTLADGTYALTGLADGTYGVGFSASGSGLDYAPQFYGGNAGPSSTLEDAQAVVVSSGELTENIDATLAAGAQISGTVTDSSTGDAIPNVTVELSADDLDVYETATTNAAGEYSFSGLPADAYTVGFSLDDGSYAPQCYDGDDECQLSVGAGADLTGVNVALAPSAEVEGTVTDAVTGAPLDGIGVTVLDGDGDSVGFGETDQTGAYAINGLPAGSYTLEFQSQYSSEDYVSEYYGGGSSFAGAQRFALTSGQTAGGLNAQLTAAGSIAGVLTSRATGNPVVNADVVVMDSDDEEVASASPGTDGHYQITGLASGSYRVLFQPWSQTEVQQWYGGATSFDAASTVSVTAGQQTGGIDAALEASGSISGVVTDATSGVDLAGVDVDAYDADGDLAGQATTDGSGAYQLTDLAPGAYTVEFAATRGSFQTEYYGDSTTAAGAAMVTVSAAQDSSGVDVALAGGGAITGSVTDASGGVSIAGATVEALGGTKDRIEATTTTGAAGDYTLAGLATGSYTVAISASGYVADSVSDIAVSDGQTTVVTGQALSAGATISGTVVAASGQSTMSQVYGYAALGDVQVLVCSSSGSCSSTATGPNGTYSAAGLAAGSYTVEFLPPADEDVLSQYYDDASSATSAQAVTLAAGQVATGVDASLAPAGEISGTVIDAASGQPLENTQVNVYGPGGSFAGAALTNLLGQYTVPGLATGSYTVEFEDSSANQLGNSYVDQYYDGQPGTGNATPVSVTAGYLTTDIGAELTLSGQISGTITDSQTGASLTDVEVTAIDSNGDNVAQTWSDDGDYSLSGLAPGTYTLSFEDQNGTLEYYDEQTTAAAADPVTVLADQTTTADEQFLSGEITGTVTSSATGQPAPGVDVTLYDSSDDYVESVTTASDGTYQLPSLPAGDYEVEFSGSDEFVTQYYSGAASLASATVVAVSLGQVTQGIDASLDPGGSVSGTVTSSIGAAPIAGADIYACPQAGGICVYGESDSSGDYQVGGLEAGSYDVWVDANGYVQSSVETASVSDDQATSGIDFSLAPGATISGKVTSAASGDSLSDAEVALLEPNGSGGTYEYEIVYTGAHGGYSFTGLPSGTYEVEFLNGSAGNYAPQYYEDTPDAADATQITLATGATQSGVDAALSAGASISGEVIAASGSSTEDQVYGYAALPDVEVVACSTSADACQTAFTENDGTYAIDGLAAGSYTVSFTAPSADDLVSQYYNDESSAAAADPVAVSAGGSTTGVDASMQAGGEVTGQVTGPDGIALDDVDVEVYDSGGNVVASAFTGDDGEYTIAGLPAGGYRVEFYDYGIYPTQYYDGATTLADAAPVSVSIGGDTSVDAQLSGYGSISGTVTAGSSGDPVQGATVTLYGANGDFVGSATTDQTGDYTLTDVSAGSYSVEFSDPGRYASEYYEGSPAATVTVDAGVATTAIDASLSAGGGVSGQVTDASTGNDLVGATVTVSTSGGGWAATATTGADGDYLVAGLASGSYEVTVSDAGYVSDTFEVSVQGDQTTGDEDAELQPGATVVGDVTYAASGTAASGADVELIPVSGGSYENTTTDSSGDYSFEGVPAGTYTVEFSPLSGPSFITQFYGDASTLANAETFAVAGAQTYSGIDAELDLGASISGAVTSQQTGAALTDAEVVVLSPSGQLAGTAVTDGSGDYQVGGLVAGDYYVLFVPESGTNLLPALYGAVNSGSPEELDLGVDQQLTGIDAALGAGGEVEGAVTSQATGAPISGVTVSVEVDTSGYQHELSATTGSDGTYTLEGLPAGTYTVDFDDGTGLHQDADASDVQVTAGQETTGVNASMVAAAVISGSLTDIETGAPVSAGDVTVYASSSNAEVASTQTASNGTYQIGYLPAGDYYVEFSSGSSGVDPGASQFYDDGTSNQASASTLTVDGETVTPNVDGQLTPLPVESAPPVINGTAQQAQTLTATNGTWSPSPTSYNYEWFDCDASGANCNQISGATGQSYTLTASDVGSTIEVEEQATDAGGSSAYAVSAQTAVVLPLPPVAQTLPAITGTAQDGQTLTEVNGTWSNAPTSYSYQWFECDPSGDGCAPVGDGTQAYTLTDADVGDTIEVRETASNAGGSGTPVMSLLTAVVLPLPPSTTGQPLISGLAEQGATLTELHAPWSGSPSSYGYQWFDCDASGSSCEPIGGATGQSYTLGAGDVGSTVEVSETATNAGGTGGPVSSAATAVVVPEPPVDQTLPAITGTAQDGQTLTEVNGTWSNAPTSYGYQWFECDASGEGCTPVGNGTQSYVLSDADVGHTLEVQETASNAGGSGFPVMSLPTSVVLPLPPVNSAPPTISGTAAQGDTLTLTQGSWSNSPTSTADQWERCDASGENCSALDDSGSTYLLTSADVGFTIEVSETATNAGGTSGPVSSVATAVVVPEPPVDQTLPQIDGTAQVGTTLTEVNGTWTNQPTEFKYEWFDCDASGEDCVEAANDTGAQTYVPTAGEVGDTIEVQETAGNSGGYGSPVISVQTAAVLPLPPGNSSPPTIAGTAAQGDTLTLTQGSWSGSPTSIADQWERCDSSGQGCQSISGATGQTYVPVGDDVGHELEVQETATNSGGAGTPVSSSATAVITPTLPSAESTPSISGSAMQGVTLLAQGAQWTNQPTSYAYQWLRCDSTGSDCQTISDATADDYTLGSADLGSTIEVQETATNLAGTTAPVGSSPTAIVVPPPPANTTAPSVSGTAEEGATLSLTQGVWTNSPTTVSDQWERCDSSGGDCQPILGAVGLGYTPTYADVGDTIEVQETATNAGGSGGPVSSTPTAVVTGTPLTAEAGEPITATAGAPVTFDGSGSVPASAITSYSWSFGDGNTGSGATTEHTYQAAGTYTAQLTVGTGAATATSSVAVTVEPSSSPVGAVTVQDQGGSPLSGATVVYVAPDGSRVSATSNSDGVADLSGLPDGTDTIYGWANGYQVAVGSIAIDGGSGSATLTLTQGQVATASLTSTPMTLAEIEAAGINPNDPGNQNVYQFTVSLHFPPGYDGSSSGSSGAAPSLCGYVNGDGQFVGDTGGCGGGGGNYAPVCTAGGCYGPGYVAVPVMVDGDPLIEWLTLSGQASVLKQFFSVDMVINNLSPSSVSLDDGSATLDVPNGLSLAPTATPQSVTQTVSSIAGGSSADVSWIVRGDQPGDYYLAAQYQGMLDPIEAPVDLDATLQSPLQVWGANGLSLSVQADSGSLAPGQPYHIRLALTNVADVPFYNVGLSVDDSAPAQTIWQPQQGFSDTVTELDPGQTLYSKQYILVPDAASAGQFDPSSSMLTFAGQTEVGGSNIQAVTPPTLYSLTSAGDVVGDVHLHWQSVPGASAYEVFTTPSLNTAFAAAPASVFASSTSTASVSQLPGTATDAYIPEPSGSVQYYAVSAIVDGIPTLAMPVISASPGTPQVSTGGGGSSTVTGASTTSGGGASPPCPGATTHTYGVLIFVGCFGATADGGITTQQPFRLDGLNLDPSGSPATYDPADQELTGSPELVILGHALPFTFPAVRLSGQGISFEYNSAGEDADADADDSSDSDDDSGDLDGLGLSGLTAAFSLSDGGSTTVGAGLNLGGIEFLTDANIASAQASFSFSNDVGGLESAEGNLGLIQALGFMGLKDANLGWDRTGSGADDYYFTIGAGFQLDPLMPEISGSLYIGPQAPYLEGGSIEASDLGPDYCIDEVLCLDKIGGNLRVTHDSLTVGGNVGVSLGPEMNLPILGNTRVVGVDGSLQGTFDAATASSPASVTLTADGDADVFGYQVATGTATLNLLPHLSAYYDGDIGLSLAGTGFKGSGSGGFANGKFELDASGKVTAFGLPGASGQAILSSKGVGACGTELWVTVGWSWDYHGIPEPMTGCGLGKFDVNVGTAAAASGPTSRTLRVSAAAKELVIRVPLARPEGTVTLTGPGGTRVSTSLSKPVVSNAGLAFYDSETGTLYFVVHGRVGRYTLVSSVPDVLRTPQTAESLPPVSGHGRVTAAGAKYRLSWHFKPIAGQTIEFYDRAGTLTQALSTAAGSNGSLTFEPLAVRARQSIVAIVDQYGIPRQTLKLTTFHAKQPAPLHKPQVRITRSGSRVSIAVAAQNGVSKYVIAIQIGNGASQRQTRHTARPRVVLSSVPPRDAVQVSVTGWSKDGRVTPAARAEARAAKR